MTEIWDDISRAKHEIAEASLDAKRAIAQSAEESKKLVVQIVETAKERLSYDTHNLINEVKLLLVERIEEERKTNKTLYAIKMIETMFFSFVWLICVAVIAALLRNVIK